MSTDRRGTIRAMRDAARNESRPERREVADLFYDAEVWVELTDRGSVKIDEDGWVYVYSDQAMLPGGQLVGFAADEGLEVEAKQITGERLRYLVGPDVGIILDADYSSECRIQVPAATPVTRDEDQA